MLDCTGVLVPKLFQNPSPVAYNSAGTGIPVVPNGINDIFTHNARPECPISFCDIRDKTCSGSFASVP